MKEEEKKIVEHLKKISKDRTIIPLDDEILIAVNLIEKLQRENEKYKRLSEMNLKNAEEFKNNMCEHRCVLKSELEEKTTILLAGAEKVKQLKKEIEQLHEQIDKMNSFMKKKIIEESEVSYENTEENQKKE